MNIKTVYQDKGGRYRLLQDTVIILDKQLGKTDTLPQDTIVVIEEDQPHHPTWVGVKPESGSHQGGHVWIPGLYQVEKEVVS